FNEIIARQEVAASRKIPGEEAFRLTDTYGFPSDLTQLMAREIGFTVDEAGFESQMEQQRNRGRAAQKKETIHVNVAADVEEATEFVGYETLECVAVIRRIISMASGGLSIALEKTPFYAEMGGQVGDAGIMEIPEVEGSFRVLNTIKANKTFYHQLEVAADPRILSEGLSVRAVVEANRRRAIQCNHSATHLLHWALHEVVSRDTTQKGSSVGPDKLTFDFNSAALTREQIADIENLVNERIRENAAISWLQVPYHEVRGRSDIMQFFEDQYGGFVRVVQIGGEGAQLNGYSMELCAGTHCRATGELGFFRIVSEGAVAAGVRRIEALAGVEAYHDIRRQTELLHRLAKKMNAPLAELERKLDAALAQSKALEKQLRSARCQQAATIADDLLKRIRMIGSMPVIIDNLGKMEVDILQAIADSLKTKFEGTVVLGCVDDNVVSLISTVSSAWTSRISAGKIIQEITKIVSGKGGGRPDSARGGGRDASRLGEALQYADELIRCIH
ncbi:MAG: alanine--tRNA ligase, partial [Verrucomicrobia bacterium]